MNRHIEPQRRSNIRTLEIKAKHSLSISRNDLRFGPLFFHSQLEANVGQAFAEYRWSSVDVETPLLNSLNCFTIISLNYSLYSNAEKSVELFLTAS